MKPNGETKNVEESIRGRIMTIGMCTKDLTCRSKWIVDETRIATRLK